MPERSRLAPDDELASASNLTAAWTCGAGLGLVYDSTVQVILDPAMTGVKDLDAHWRDYAETWELPLTTLRSGDPAVAWGPDQADNRTSGVMFIRDGVGVHVKGDDRFTAEDLLAVANSIESRPLS